MPVQLGCLAIGAAHRDAVQGVRDIAGVRVRPMQFVRHLERLQDLPAGVADGDRELGACPGPDGVGVQAAAQVPAGPGSAGRRRAHAARAAPAAGAGGPHPARSAQA